MKAEFIEKIYAGWLGKIIGIRLGAPIEGWTYERIKNIYEEIHGYIADYKRFGADDDSNVPLFFLRALEDSGLDLSPRAVGEALLNYSPYERGFFWFGGYGVSTEHTAYLNLRAGIPAPLSGSIEHNGKTVAEQIGGQIFIDAWGLVCPGNPDLAARFAEMAASVTHGGNGVYGGMFIAACIAYAFEEKNIRAIIEKGLSYIPADCEYTRAVRAVMRFYDQNPASWRDCYQYIFENFGYDKYPGACHIIPNISVMILALLYGEGDFEKTLCIGTMCGWDTDCNVGNLGAIMGVICGTEGIDYYKWRKPVNDFLVTASTMGSMNIMDIPFGAAYIAKMACRVAGEELPEPWDMLINQRIDSCHFEFPGSTHAMEVRREDPKADCQAALTNSREEAATGKRSLKVHVKLPYHTKESVYVFKRTHLFRHDFDANGYGVSFSPLLYPGQTIRGSVLIPTYGSDCRVRLYAKDAATGNVLLGDLHEPTKGEWAALSFTIPDAELIQEAGFAFEMQGKTNQPESLVCFIDDFYFEGQPNYKVTLTGLKEAKRGETQQTLSQFTVMKGLCFIEDDMLNLSCADYAEMYTGRHDWKDYTAGFVLQPVMGHDHYVNIRVQGAMRSYAAGFSFVGGGKMRLMKNESGKYRVLRETDFAWEKGHAYTLTIRAQGNRFTVWVDGVECITFTDETRPYLTGAIGLSVQNGSRCGYRGITIA